MKYSILYFACMVLFIGACKKEADDSPTPGSGNSISYRLTAPTCLLTKMSFPNGGVSYPNGETIYSYDSLKRIVRQSQYHDSSIITYSYIGNTILQTATRTNEDGNTTTYRSTHYLNASGFIDSTRGEKSAYTSIYNYNDQGYLILHMYKNPTSSTYSGRSYEYSDGDLIRVYDLIFDSQTGTITNTTLSMSYTYYTDKPCKMGEFRSWVGRIGRGNSHAVKTEQYRDNIDTHTYEWGANNLPVQESINRLSQDTILRSYTWQCY